jgi:peptide deformylase
MDIKKIEVWRKVLEELSEVVYAGDPGLRRETKKATVEEGVKIGRKLAETLMKYRKIAGYGRGLAAPQIGVNKSVFVTFVDNHIQVFINPKIITKSQETNYYRELCLSCGIMSADTKRAAEIEMQWTDEFGKKHQEKFGDFLARLYQHEEAHLRGILNLDEAEKGGIEVLNFDPLQEKIRDKR